MGTKREGGGKKTKRTSLNELRMRERFRREREVVREAFRLRGLTPSQRISVLIDLSDLCVELGRGTKK